MSMSIKTPSASRGKTPAAWDAKSTRSSYKAYRSPFGPQYKTAMNYHGITPATLVRYGVLAGGFGGVAGIFAIFFFAEVPRVREDIMKKIPVLGSYFVKEIPPEDNPF
ncbi:ubiquinol-cytochrome-c reductase complex subunit-domain-containing protein [Clohesyomyces aquaticus]|uniref:Ubiquinol-cytochrome-c reductase complex subunit-domain-containing protein n=1 Tax=Clohesyomyces aquaticus TaxID=1231657 RepID=A0A1Y1ZZ30_9PLEO|nr:ubiquinol-cytochrome-c reductase complex subunit-domain-containing protein [Clohesyomyces aquaticus]